MSLLPARDVFESDLLRDEEILWFGQPDPSILLTKLDVFLIPFSVLWAGFAFFASGGLAALILALLPFPQMGTFPESKALLEALPWLLFILGVFVIPATYLIIYGSRRLSPSRLSILLMAEALTGVISAAVLTDEPFGLREAAGAVLIGAAGVVEVMRRQPPLAQPT